MSRSTIKRLQRMSPCGCFHCFGRDRPTRTQQKRAWRRDWTA